MESRKEQERFKHSVTSLMDEMKRQHDLLDLIDDYKYEGLQFVKGDPELRVEGNSEPLDIDYSELPDWFWEFKRKQVQNNLLELSAKIEAISCILDNEGKGQRLMEFYMNEIDGKSFKYDYTKNIYGKDLTPKESAMKLQEQRNGKS